MRVKNIYADTGRPQDPGREYTEDLLAVQDLRIERIISRGHVSPPDFWYEQQTNEWVLVARGRASLEFEGGRMVHLAEGDCLFLPAGMKHRVTYTSKNPECTWVAVHFP
jgi:cupin 2 domain-containing protein